jgi:hypothetical protein
MANPVTDDGGDPRTFVVALTFASYASSSREAAAEARKFAAKDPAIVDVGTPVPAGLPGEDPQRILAQLTVGRYILLAAPDDVDPDELLCALEQSTIAEVVGEVAATFAEAESETTG